MIGIVAAGLVGVLALTSFSTSSEVSQATGEIETSSVEKVSDDPRDQITTNMVYTTPKGYIEIKLLEANIENQFAADIIADCGSEVMCALKVLKIIAETEDKESMVSIVQELIATYDGAGIFCHTQGHHLGSFMYGVADDLRDALTLVTITCGGSQVHGVIENYFVSEVFSGKSPDDVELTGKCDVLGENLRLQIRFDCAHGMGHGVLKVYDHDVFPALERCSELETGLEREACNLGIFMENIIISGQTRYQKGTLTLEDPLYPCTEVDEKYYDSCWLYQTSHMKRVFRNDEVKMLEACGEVDSPRGLQICYQGVGREFAGTHYYHQDWEGLAARCDTAEGHNKVWCLSGAVLALADMRTTEAFDFCAILDEENKQHCYLTVGSHVQRLSLPENQIEQECSMAENDHYNKVCLSRAMRAL